jgi:hypothetical protein
MFATQLAPLRTVPTVQTAPRRNVTAAAAKPGAAEKKVWVCSQLRKRGGNAGGVVTQRCACYSRRCRLEFEHAAAAASPGRAAGDRLFARVAAAAAPSAAPDTLPCQDFLTWLNEMMVKDSSEYAGYGATPSPALFAWPPVSNALALWPPAQRPCRWPQKRALPALRGAGAWACLE